MTNVNGYENAQGAIVVPDCPDADGEHSHFLIPDEGNNYEQAHDNGDGTVTYICPIDNDDHQSSGNEITVVVR